MRDSPLRVVIAGAAHGVGRLCALSLAEWNLDLILCDDDGPALHSVTSALGCLGRFCDVASEASVSILAAELLERFHSIDALINAAGPKYVRQLGTWRMSQALLPALRRAHGNALIVNVAQSRPSGGDDPFAYASSDEAAAGLSQALVDATRGSNVHIATISGEPNRSCFRSPHPSLGASQAVAVIAKTFGLPPFGPAASDWRHPPRRAEG